MKAKRPGGERAVYTLRIGESERRILEAAAEQRREYLSEFIRRVSLMAARRELAGAAGLDEVAR